MHPFQGKAYIQSSNTRICGVTVQSQTLCTNPRIHLIGRVTSNYSDLLLMEYCLCSFRISQSAARLALHWTTFHFCIHYAMPPSWTSCIPTCCPPRPGLVTASHHPSRNKILDEHKSTHASIMITHAPFLRALSPCNDKRRRKQSTKAIILSSLPLARVHHSLLPII
ncbi:uncharacterized protein B0I36DRAFT_502 [Microdochium trichocladiopsis]|uniref:Uncharacterized protein n=1 Tax=Microdochium trichocladiopsis TaxID=1682393 RepID=A0A9P8YGQ6_9PEZI|nr:uncharacterized protein B0I36DRAFT_502 [Microdochium trichocladiopsis]KAH7039618.1 hypothetical protein B0I36DRAFT_502 [Microdochium trichocladiopsis]